jgi:hypothetical protein
MPHTFWFNYKSVVPTQERYQVGEQLRFRSFSHIKREVAFTWTDILRCETSDGPTFYSVYESSATGQPNGGYPENPNAWNYNAQTPDSPTVCHLQSDISIALPLGITKTQTVLGREFEIYE